MAELEAWRVAWPQDAERLCVEEATVRRHPTRTAPWCVVDENPAVPTGDDHTTVHVYGAVAPLTGRTPYQISPTLGRGEFARFLQHLLTCDPGKGLLVMHERGAQHKGTSIEEVIRTADGRLGRIPQPAYSPALTPQERIWKWRRRGVTHNHWFATLREQIEAIRNVFRYRAGVKNQVVRLCGFKTPESFVASL
jgi:transposase